MYNFGPLLVWVAAWLIDGVPDVHPHQNFIFVSLIVAAVAGLVTPWLTVGRGWPWRRTP